jgi:hypothetical protein
VAQPAWQLAQLHHRLCKQLALLHKQRVGFAAFATDLPGCGTNQAAKSQGEVC